MTVIDPFAPALVDHYERSSIALLEFSWGPYSDPVAQVERYCDAEGDQILLGAKWTSVPSMEILLPKRTLGMSDDESTKIRVPSSVGGIFSRLSSGEPHGRVITRVMELITGPITQNTELRSDLFYHAFGIVGDGTENADRQPGIVSLTIDSAKEMLSGKTAGVMAGNHCDHALFGHGCELDPSGKSAFVALTALDGVKATLTGSGVESQPNTFLDDGYVIGPDDGLRLKVRKWGGQGSNEFTLSDQPPQRWLSFPGSQILLVAGCAQTLTKCKFWNNEIRFGGYGYAIPGKDPRFRPQ